MKHKKLVAILAIAASAILICGCQNNTTSTFPDENATYEADIAALGTSNRFAGVVSASGETKIEKEEDKAIDEIKVSAGQDIKKGDVLFTYDGEQAQLNYDKAKLELEQLKLSVESYNEQIAQLENEKAQADGSEQLSYTLQIQEIETNIREANYNIGVKEKEVAKLKKGLKKLTIKSPIDGKVQSINTEDAMDASGNKLPFMMLMNTGTYRVKAYVNEANARELYEGAAVIIRSRTDDRTWSGTISTVDFDNPVNSQQGAGFDTGDISEITNSSKYPFYVELDNADGLMLGQHVFVEVDIEFSAPVDTPAEDEIVEGEPSYDPENE